MEGPIAFKNFTETIPPRVGLRSRATPDEQCLICLPSKGFDIKKKTFNHWTFTDMAMRLCNIYMTANIIQKCKQSVLLVVKWDVFISKIWKFLDQKELWIDTFRFSNLLHNHVGGIGKNVGIVDVLGYRSKMDCSFKSGK